MLSTNSRVNNLKHYFKYSKKNYDLIKIQYKKIESLFSHDEKAMSNAKR